MKYEYRERYCQADEDFTMQYPIETHFAEWHSATYKCVRCGCLEHVTGEETE